MTAVQGDEDPRPNPGSDEALEMGCTCAVLDNNHGQYPAFGGGWWISANCPVHGFRVEL